MRLYHLLSSEYALENIEYRRLKIAEIGDLNDPFELVAVDQSDKQQRVIWRNWRKDQEKKWGLLCFSKSWKSPVLWSHYADKHKGMALGFDVDDQLLMPVKYTRKRLNLDVEKLFDTGKLDQVLMNKLMRTKFLDWAYEKEVRVYASLTVKDPVKGLYFADFSQKMKLKEVIAGPLCAINEATISKHLNKEDANVKLIKARLAFQTFDVVRNKKGFI